MVQQVTKGMKNKDLLKLIPVSVRITPKVTYEVVWVQEFANDAEQMGETRRNEQLKQIVISARQPEGEMFKTFLHEAIHAIDLESDIGLTEKQVQKLENGIFKVLKLNNIFDKLLK